MVVVIRKAIKIKIICPLISEQVVVIRMMLNNILGEAKADIRMIDVNINIRTSY